MGDFMYDTIVGISTALGIGAISIIRVSGKESIDLVSKIFTKDLNKVESHTINYGYIKDVDKVIDEVLVSVMREPKTFTKENVVEINCHGGITSTNRVLKLLLEKGARLAEPGEFTKRAFLNGRIDLIEAESIMDLINSKTESARRLAFNGINGNISNMIESLRTKISHILSNIEANIDYPEYEDILVITKDIINKEIYIIEEDIKKILKESENGKIIKEGINTLILGKPNVGKSSLLNTLLGEEKAIVTEIPGTTRDLIEGFITIEGITFNIIDTAGIRETEDVIEKIGVNKSLNLIEESDLIILLLNNNEPLEKEDLELLEKTQHRNRIIVINKIDLENKLKKEKLNGEIVEISAINNNISDLKKKMIQMFNLEEIITKDPNYLFNNRQVGILKNTLENIKDIKLGIESNLPIDLIEIDLKQIWESLGEIIGKNYKEELVDEIFKNFCLGK